MAEKVTIRKGVRRSVDKLNGVTTDTRGALDPSTGQPVAVIKSGTEGEALSKSEALDGPPVTPIDAPAETKPA